VNRVARRKPLGARRNSLVSTTGKLQLAPQGADSTFNPACKATTPVLTPTASKTPFNRNLYQHQPQISQCGDCAGRQWHLHTSEGEAGVGTAEEWRTRD